LPGELTQKREWKIWKEIIRVRPEFGRVSVRVSLLAPRKGSLSASIEDARFPELVLKYFSLRIASAFDR
jgi:hypothetical protein